MRVGLFRKFALSKIILFSMLFAFIFGEATAQEIAVVDSTGKSKELCYSNTNFSTSLNIGKGIKHRRYRRVLNGKYAVVNIITANPDVERLIIKPSYGSYKINSVKRVTEFANTENAIAGVNASFFKPDTGIPLGASVVNGEILTGPLYNRVVFGITKYNKFKTAKLKISGKIKIGDDTVLPLTNINQPITNNDGFTVYTDRWGYKTPKTSEYQCHISVQNGRIQYIKQSSIPIPQGGYVVVGPRKLIPKNTINRFDGISYTAKFNPDDWNDIKYAIGGGPYLVKNGKIFIDKQRFNKSFLWSKAPRTAVGYTKAGVLILVTVDGRQEGSDGATLTELAKIMYENGAYNAINLDGGSSSQMVYKGKLISNPSVKGGSRVTNALLIIPDLKTTSIEY